MGFESMPQAEKKPSEAEMAQEARVKAEQATQRPEGETAGNEFKRANELLAETKRAEMLGGIANMKEDITSTEENIKSISIPLEKVSLLNSTILAELNSKHSNDQFYAVLFKGDAMKGDQYLKNGEIDILFYTKFRHHLTNSQRTDFDKMALSSSDHIIEDDLLNNLFMFTVPLIGRSQWKHPVLLNGGMFSALRCPTRKEVQQLPPNWSIKITPDGYTKVYDACWK